MKLKNLCFLSILPIALVLLGFANEKSNHFLIADASNNGNRFVPTDPYYTGAKTVSGSRGSCYQNISMNHVGDMESVWNDFQGDGVTIAIIDSGIDIKHPDFVGKIDSKSAYFEQDKKYVGTSYLSHDRNDGGYNDHGSNVAGVAAASANDEGTVGIAPNANLLICKSDLTIGSIVNAIKYAADCKADVINLSLGCYAQAYYDGYQHKTCDVEYEDYIPGVNNTLATAIDYAYNKGCIIVAAAGNECTDTNSYPAANNHVIGVGAFSYNSSTEIAPFSNYNKSTAKKGDNCNVDLVAPGYVVTPSFDGKSSYKQTQGTSFSAPIVAGAAALWKQKNPTGKPSDFEKALYEHCTDLGDPGWDKIFGYGALNIYALMTDFEIDVYELLLKVGSTYQLKITKAKKTDVVTLVSSDETIITVKQDGLITAISEGTAYITATCNGVSKRIDVTVKKTISPVIHLGCSGNIMTASLILSCTAISLIPVLLIYKEKKERKIKK